MSFAMSKTEREAFLQAVRVGVLSITQTGRGPLASPVWYDYSPGGDLWFLTQNTSRKGKAMEIGARITMTVQSESSPYAYVSVEGPVSAIEAYDFDADLGPMAARYKGEAEGKAYIEQAKAAPRARPASETNIKVTMTPENWLTVDYGKRGN
jgi:hypothetical protein